MSFEEEKKKLIIKVGVWDIDCLDKFIRSYLV